MPRQARPERGGYRPPPAGGRCRTYHPWWHRRRSLLVIGDAGYIVLNHNHNHNRFDGRFDGTIVLMAQSFFSGEMGGPAGPAGGRCRRRHYGYMILNIYLLLWLLLLLLLLLKLAGLQAQLAAVAVEDALGPAALHRRDEVVCEETCFICTYKYVGYIYIYIISNL